MRVGRECVSLSCVEQVAVPIAANDRQLPVLLATMAKHMREQSHPELFLIPPELRVTSQLDGSTA